MALDIVLCMYFRCSCRNCTSMTLLVLVPDPARWRQSFTCDQCFGRGVAAGRLTRHPAPVTLVEVTAVGDDAVARGRRERRKPADSPSAVTAAS